jgi:hypothetical protein
MGKKRDMMQQRDNIVVTARGEAAPGRGKEGDDAS